MKIKKTYLKNIIKNYLNESLNEDEGSWLDDDDEKDTEEFGEEAEYPQVNVGFRHIGGLKDTLHYCQQEGLLP